MSWFTETLRHYPEIAIFLSLGIGYWVGGKSYRGFSLGAVTATLLAAIADFESDLIKERTGEGRKRAMSKGVRFGRKPKLSDYQRTEALKRRAAGETLADIAKSYGVHLSMISRL